VRLRKKKNLDQRIISSRDYLIICEHYDFYKCSEQDKYRCIDILATFGNTNPTYLEIGCGKGGFVTDMARANPDVNFIAVEKISNVIICAIDKARAEGLDNVRFLCCDASNLQYYIKANSVEKLFLNFSCPWPKRKYQNQRLTHQRFLTIYDGLLTASGEIWQKTDSELLFDYSVRSLTEYGFVLQNVTRDLASSNCTYNVTTEYERFFISKGKPIYRLEARRKG